MYDRVEITVVAGSGGSGAVSFRREKYIPYGGPDGGDGGEGGNVIIKADPGITDLKMFKPRRAYEADHGEDGKGKKKHGKTGKDLVLNVPVGTIALGVGETAEGLLIADCEVPGQEEVVAKGGRGGQGNSHYATSTNQAPRIAQKGEKGEERSLILEMRLIADVGIIGFPNAGKSTLLSKVSAANPKIASYPFTTLEPIPGVVKVGQHEFVIVEIPGLIEGAHLGKGLGFDFLRHIVRTRMLIHLVDGNSESPINDMIRVNSELSLYDPELMKKPQIVAINKTDLPGMAEKIPELKAAFKDAGIRAVFISAETGEGVHALMEETSELLGSIDKEIPAGKKVPTAVFHPGPKKPEVSVTREGNIWVVTAPALERLVAGVDITSYEVQRQLQRFMVNFGVVRALEKAGVKPGERVRCGEYEWNW